MCSFRGQQGTFLSLPLQLVEVADFPVLSIISLKLLQPLSMVLGSGSGGSGCSLVS